MRLFADINLALFTFLAGTLSVAKGDSNGGDIYTKILNGHNPLVRPSAGNISVEIELSLSQLLDVDTRRQVMTTSSVVNLFWNDNSLSWNQRQYPKLSKVILPASRIWTPNIILWNSIENHQTDHAQGEVSISPSGQVKWSFVGTFKSTCTIDVTYYPFDQQTCLLKFGPYMDKSIHIGLYLKRNWIRLNTFYPSVSWDVIEVPAYENVYTIHGSDEVETDLTFYLTIRRKSLGISLTEIVPLLAIGFLTIIPVLVDKLFGKLTLQIACLAGLLKLSKDAADTLPETALVISHLAKYVYSLVALNLIHLTLTCVIAQFRKHQFDWATKYIPKEVTDKVCVVLLLRTKPKPKFHTGNENEIVGENEIKDDKKIQRICHRLLGIFILVATVIATWCFLFDHPYSGEDPIDTKMSGISSPTQKQ